MKVRGTGDNDLLDRDDGITDQADEIFGLGGDDTIKGSGGADRIDGGDGIDTVSYLDSSKGVFVDLYSRFTSSGGTAAGDVLTNIENLIGSAYDDSLLGNATANVLIGANGNDWLFGYGGADTLDGGTGIDSTSYGDSSSAVNVDLGTGQGTGGDAEGDVLISIENLHGSAYDDVLKGNGSANLFEGWTGDDIIRGGGGDDAIEGGYGADMIDGGGDIDTARYFDSREGVSVNLATGQGFGGSAEGDHLYSIENLQGSFYSDFLVGNASDNTLSGFGGDDTLMGGDGTDTIDGGEGIDTASYRDSREGVTVSLATGRAFGGTAEGDILNSIEHLTGSAHDDYLKGNASDNTLSGLGGSDTLIGGGGADTLDGGEGIDTLNGGSQH